MTLVDVAFSGKTAGGRCELDVVGAACDDTLSRLDAAPHANQVAVACSDLDVSPGKALAAHLHKDIWPAGLHQDGVVGNSDHPLATAGVKDRDRRLTDEEMAGAIVDVELHGQGTRLRV